MEDGSSLSLTINEAIEQSRLSRSSLYDAINRGDLTAKKFGRKTLILRSELERFLAHLPAYQAAA